MPMFLDSSSMSTFATAEEIKAGEKIETAERLAEKLKVLKGSKKYLSDGEIAAFKKDHLEKMERVASMNAKIQPLMKAGDPDQVPLLAEAVERLAKVVGRSQVDVPADAHQAVGNQEDGGR